MKRGLRNPLIALVSLIVSLLITLPALAVPTLPSSFYGSVKVNNSNVPDGTSIQALIGGQVYAEGFTQTYEGGSVYSLDVKGDDTDTAAQDGGREGDTIQFKIGGALAGQTGVWHTGTNVMLNLTTTTSEPIGTPEATTTPYPTQTAITVIQPSPMPTSTRQASVSPTPTAQPSLVATQPVQPSATAGIQTQASQTPVTPDPGTENGPDNNTTLLIFAIVAVVAGIAAVILLLLGKKKM